MTILTEREKAILSIHTGYKLTSWEEMFKVAEEITGKPCSNTFLFNSKNPNLKALCKKIEPMAVKIINKMVEDAGNNE